MKKTEKLPFIIKCSLNEKEKELFEIQKEKDGFSKTTDFIKHRVLCEGKGLPISEIIDINSELETIRRELAGQTYSPIIDQSVRTIYNIINSKVG